ncbi:hypothetical protein TNCV_3705331 [Trichonephila clavipes]|nr:hypothetical protein TNCV_3705331 [Trichonephila clavipes]
MSNGSLNAECKVCPLSNKVTTMSETVIINEISYCNGILAWLHLQVQLLYEMKVRTRDSNVKSFDLILEISSKITGVSEIQIQIFIPEPKIHSVPAFGTPTPARSVLERVGRYGGLALSRKVTGVSIIQFQIFVPYPESHQLHDGRGRPRATADHEDKLIVRSAVTVPDSSL